MALNDYRVGAAVPVSDMGRARDFYEGRLGLSADGDDSDGGRTYQCGDGTTLHVFPSAGARGSDATVAAWEVDDIERVVDELTANGVTFARYDDDTLRTDERGIATMGASRGAWFRDPAGNVLGLVQP